MHVVFRESHGLDDTETPIDLKQDPADLIVLSFSDSDLGAFMAGWKRANGDLPSLRLANLTALKHPLSVDEYIERTASHARAILVRLIGGEDYWPYGLASLSDLARKKGVALAVLPADGQDDPRLNARSTLPQSTLDRLRMLCDTGGAIAAQAALAQLALAAGISARPVIGQKTVPDQGYYLPEIGTLKDYAPDEAPICVVFYRSYLTAADLGPIDDILHELKKRGHEAIGVFAPTLKNTASRDWIRSELSRIQPKAIINATAFSAHLGQEANSPLDIAEVPVFQISLSTARKKDWEKSDRGLSPQDLAMHVVLPEVDGRIYAGVASFKAIEKRDPELQYARFVHRGHQDQIARILDKVDAWVKLGELPAHERKITMVLSTYPGKDYQMAHAVGCDALQSAENITRILHEEGYGNSAITDLYNQFKTSRFHIPIQDYLNWISALPQSMQDMLNDTWGAPENDALAENGNFVFQAISDGNLQIALQPDRGRRALREDDYHDLSRVPCHSYVAFYLWLQNQGTNAIVHVGTHGTLEWLPGKSVALSSTCWPEVLAGNIPVIYPFIVNDPGEAAMAKRRISAITLGHLPPPLEASETPDALQSLEHLLDEYSTADGLDPKRRDRLISNIRQTAQVLGVEKNLGIDENETEIEAIAKIDRFVCDIKESQFGAGLHIFGEGQCGADERSGLLLALNGRRVEAGPSGSPYRGRSDVMPTGRNLYPIDPRALPTRSAYAHGVKLAEELVRRHLQDHGDYPKNIILDLWGSATMRTAGEEFAMAMHLAGVAPKWDQSSERVAGFEILPLSLLNRPRVGITLRISGLFRDVFSGLAQLFEQAVQALRNRVIEGIETIESNPYGDEMPRVFAPQPQSYGIAIEALPDAFDEASAKAAGEAWLRASEWAVDAQGALLQNREAIDAQVKKADGFVHVQDLVETDILIAEDYANHQGGIAAARTKLGAGEIANYHIDHSHAGAPIARALSEEIARIVYARASNPKWLGAMMKHEFRGAAEIAATLDHMAKFAHLADAVAPELFDQYYEAVMDNDEIRSFMKAHNPEALEAMKSRFYDLMSQNIWNTRKNSIRADVMEGAHGGD